MSDFTPTNPLEVALEDALAGRLVMASFLRIFAESDIALPSGGEIMADGSGFQPLLFDKGSVKMVACFTALERATGFAKQAPFCLKIKGIEFLRRVPREYGLVVNPSFSVGFDITPDGVAKIVSDFG